MLVQEFPDVFAFPQLTTTRQANEEDLYRLTDEELEAKGLQPNADKVEAGASASAQMKFIKEFKA